MKNKAKNENSFVKPYLSGLLKPHKRPVNLALSAATISLLLLIIQNYVLAIIFSDWLIAISSNHPPTMQLTKKYLPYLIVLLTVRPLLNLYKEHVLLNLSLKIRQSVRKKLLNAIVSLGMTRQYYGSDGNLSTKVLEQVDELDGFISRFHIQKYIAVITPIIIIIATAYYSFLAAALMLLTAPLVPVFMILVGSAAADKSREQFQAMSQLSGRFLDLLRGMPTLKRLQATEQASHSIAYASEKYQQRTMGVLKLAFLSGAVLELFSSLAIALVALYLGLGLLGILPWAKGDIPVPYEGALFILLLAPEFYAPLRQLGSDYHAKANAEAAVIEFYPLLAAGKDKPTQNNEDGSSLNTQSSSMLKDLLITAPSLNLTNVNITSHNQEANNKRVRLASTSLQISAKNNVAITGVSGIGKSSLLQAILGFVDFDGSIEIDGHDVNQADLINIQHRMGYLAQTSTLLPMSIGENLRLAKKEATDEELKQVLQQVDLWSLISQLPEGIETQLGERGKGLSGGQQQRLSIAQLLLRNSHLWLIDEPCAHLDPETSEQIFQLLGQLSSDKTVLLISHDLSNTGSNINWLDKVVEITAESNTQQGEV